MDFIILLLIVILLIIIARVIIANQQKIKAQTSLKKKKTLKQPELSQEEAVEQNPEYENPEYQNPEYQNTTEAQNELVDKLKSNVEEIIDGTKTFIINPLVDLSKNPLFWGSSLTRIGGEIIVRRIVEKAARLVAKRMIANIYQKASLPILRFIARLGSEKAAALAIKFSAQLAQRAALKIAQKAAIASTEKVVVKAALSLGTRVATKAATSGPVAAAFIAFDILSIGLDLGDSLSPNGPGYARMGTNELYFKIRDELQEQLRKEVEEQGDAFPIISSPLDKFNSEQFQTFVSLEASELMDLSGQAIDPVMIDYFTAIRNDLISGELQEADLDSDEVIERYLLSFVDEDLFHQKVMNNMCISHGGINVLDSKGNKVCSYASKQKCESSYSDPLTDNDTYVEWKNDKCVLSSPVLKEICKGNKLPYNSEKGSCDITEEYCKTKGADWAYNDKIKENDCIINKGQEFAELLFGTTVTRGLKQTFDPQQFTKCKDGWEDLGYSCAKCNDPSKEFHSLLGNDTAAFKAALSAGYIVAKEFGGLSKDGGDGEKVLAANGIAAVLAVAPSTVLAQGGTTALTQTGFCFNKCKPGYRNALGVCWEDCNKDEVDDGAFCRQPLDTYVRGAGRIPDKGGCDSGQRDDGTSCWEDFRCNTSCPGGGPWYNIANCRTKCSGCGCIKKTLFARQSCKPDEDKVGALCYPKCKDGFFAATPTICSNGKGKSRAKSSYTLPIADLNYTIDFKKRQTAFSTKDN